MKYYLAVSAECSANISSRLRRILNNIRRSRSITGLTLNKSDENIFNIFLSVVRLTYNDYTHEEIDEKVLLDLCEHIYIAVFDLEEGQIGEIACKMLLASHYPKNFAVLWVSLISEALELASNRSMVTYEYIKGKYINDEALKAQDRFFTCETTGETQIGYDVILARSPELLEIIDKEGKYAKDSLIVLQLYRFDETGKKEISQFYPDNRLMMPGDTTVEVIHRCSSFAGMERFLDSYLKSNVAKGTPIVWMAGNGDGQEDNFPEARLYKKWVSEQMKDKTDLYCLHCEEPISAQENYLVEIDNASEKLKVGCVHSKCLRPIDRVLGVLKGEIFDEYSYLKGFDYKFWSKAKGQRLFGELKSKGSPIAVVKWNNDIKSTRKGRFCIKANLENGDSVYVTQRGYLVRGNRAFIEAETEIHNKLLEKVSEPFGYSSISNMFGNYSLVAQYLDVGEEFNRCLSFECVPFTSTIREMFDIEGDYYSPLIYFTVEGAICVIDGYIFMLSNPLDFPKYRQNWKDKIGYDFNNEYCTVTVKNDDEFDDFMQDAAYNNIKIIVDPLFGNQKEMIRGYIIEPFDMNSKEKIE